jgi:thioredoxin-like negative regulator of GroEL
MAVNHCTRVVRPVAASQLRQLIEKSRGNPNATLFIKFASAFCGACKESRIAIDQALKSSNRCLDVVELDSDVADGMADGFNVKSLPTMVAVRNGTVVGKVEGAQQAAGYMKFFQKHTTEN